MFSQHSSWKFWTLECTVGEIRVPPTTLYSDAPSSTTWDPNDASGTVNQILDSHSRLRIYSLDDLSERSIGQKPLHIHLVSLPKLKEPAADIFCHCSWEWAMFSDGAVVILLDNVSQQLMLAATNLLGSKTAAKDSHTAPALPATLSNPYPYIVIDSVFYIADKFLRLADSLQLQRFLAFFVKQKSNVFDRLKTAYNAIYSSNAGGAGGASDVLGSSLSPINVGDSISQCNDVHRTTPVFEVALALSIEELHTITFDTIFLDQFCEVIFTDQFYDSMAWVLEVLKKMLLAAAEELEKAHPTNSQWGASYQKGKTERLKELQEKIGREREIPTILDLIGKVCVCSHSYLPIPSACVYPPIARIVLGAKAYTVTY